MNINVKTFIQTDHELIDVFNLFNKDMFYELTKKAPVKPLRYDGDFIGAEIHLLMLFPWKDHWISIITDKSESDTLCFFVDEGKQLPFNLIEWRHTHIIRKTNGGVIIEDEIYFKSTNMLFDRFWWISFLPQFLLRKGQYKRYIKKRLL